MSADKYTTVGLFSHNFWSQGSIDTPAFFTDCTILTDSVFRVLFAYFDASMGNIKWYKPQRSLNTVDITLI